MKKILLLSVFLFLFFSSGPKTVLAEENSPADNLSKATVNILTGWTEVAIYPMKEAAKSGWTGKVLFPLNIAGGGIKAVARTILGSFDLVTFFKGKNIVSSWPGEEL